MYSDVELDGAVRAGVISARDAEALRAYIAKRRDAPIADEEHFRFLSGFNDIFVTIAIIILLVALGGIGNSIVPFVGPSPFSALLIAGAAWMLAEFFTRKRRMALPSIVLLIAFVGGVFVTGIGIVAEAFPDGPGSEGDQLLTALGSLAALIAAGAAWLHWRRFKVPITVAAGAAALVATIVGIAVAIGVPGAPENVIWPTMFVAGLAVFALAMRWDAQDTERLTRRSDVAFWLHLLAAPLIVHPIFSVLGVMDGEVSVAVGLVVIVVYCALGVAALAIDRRALLVSALVYVLVTLSELFEQAGALELSFALTALVIGSALLMLSAFWSDTRRIVVTALPGGLQRRLPPVEPVRSLEPAS